MGQQISDGDVIQDIVEVNCGVSNVISKDATPLSLKEFPPDVEKLKEYRRRVKENPAETGRVFIFCDSSEDDMEDVEKVSGWCKYFGISPFIIDIDNRPFLMDEMKRRSGGRVYTPQIFFNDTYVGDFSRVHQELDRGREFFEKVHDGCSVELLELYWRRTQICSLEPKYLFFPRIRSRPSVVNELILKNVTSRVGIFKFLLKSKNKKDRFRIEPRIGKLGPLESTKITFTLFEGNSIVNESDDTFLLVTASMMNVDPADVLDNKVIDGVFEKLLKIKNTFVRQLIKIKTTPTIVDRKAVIQDEKYFFDNFADDIMTFVGVTDETKNRSRKNRQMKVEEEEELEALRSNVHFDTVADLRCGMHKIEGEQKPDTILTKNLLHDPFDSSDVTKPAIYVIVRNSQAKSDGEMPNVYSNDELWRMNVIDREWERLSTCPIRFQPDHILFYWGNCIHVINKVLQENQSRTKLEIRKFDFKKNSWSVESFHDEGGNNTNLPELEDFTSSLVRGKLYILHGISKGEDGNLEPLGAVFVIDLSTKQIQEVVEEGFVPPYRLHPTSCVVGSDIFFFGGSQYLSQLQEEDEDDSSDESDEESEESEEEEEEEEEGESEDEHIDDEGEEEVIEIKVESPRKHKERTNDPISMRRVYRFRTDELKWEFLPTKGEFPPSFMNHLVVSYRMQFLVVYGGHRYNRKLEEEGKRKGSASLYMLDCLNTKYWTKYRLFDESLIKGHVHLHFYNQLGYVGQLDPRLFIIGGSTTSDQFHRLSVSMEKEKKIDLECQNNKVPSDVLFTVEIPLEQCPDQKPVVLRMSSSGKVCSREIKKLQHFPVMEYEEIISTTNLFPQKRFGAQMVATPDSSRRSTKLLLLLGGSGPSTTGDLGFREVWAFHPERATWQVFANLPSPISRLCSFFFEDTLFLIPMFQEFPIFKIFKFNEPGDEWEEVEQNVLSEDSPPSLGYTCSVYGDICYIFHGYRLVETVHDDARKFVYDPKSLKSSVYMINLKNGNIDLATTEMMGGDLPAPRSYPRIARIGCTIYMMGGENMIPGVNTEEFQTLYEFQINGESSEEIEEEDTTEKEIEEEEEEEKKEKKKKRREKTKMYEWRRIRTYGHPPPVGMGQVFVSYKDRYLISYGGILFQQKNLRKKRKRRSKKEQEDWEVDMDEIRNSSSHIFVLDTSLKYKVWRKFELFNSSGVSPRDCIGSHSFLCSHAGCIGKEKKLYVFGGNLGYFYDSLSREISGGNNKVKLFQPQDIFFGIKLDDELFQDNK